MSQLPDLQQKFGCGQNDCGQNGGLCPDCNKLFIASTTTKCPDRNLYCSDKNPCDYCKAIAQSLVKTTDLAIGGKASDVKPLQRVHGSSNHDGCSVCGKLLGSNSQTCEICASFLESELNPAQPHIHYDPDFGPQEDSFGPCTPETRRITLDAFKASFETAKREEFPFPRINRFKRSACLSRDLLSKGTILGIEGFNHSCYYVVVFWMLSQGNMHERINTDCLSGYILYKILWDLRAGLFVGRDIVEAFRLSLQEYPLVQRSKRDFEQGMDDFGYILGLLEDDEVGVLKKGHMFSNTGCSFLVHELTAVKHGTIQEALCASVSSPSPVPEDGSIISFQFSQQKSALFTGQHLGTNFKFPYDGVVLVGKLLRPRMFTIYKSEHYIDVLCIGESYFLANSRSASQCGHLLPEMREISEQEAMALFKTQAHTIVFECIGNAYAPPTQPRSEQSGLVDSRFLPFSFEDGIFETKIRNFKKYWSYRYDVTSKICFIKSGECVEQNGIYTEYNLDGKIFIFTTLKIQIQTEYKRFIENCE